MKNCPICGTAVEDQIEFCPVCGENLRALKPVPNAEDTGSGQSENAQSENAQSENAQSDQRRLAPKPGPSGSGKIGILAVLAGCLVLAVALFAKPWKESSGGGSEPAGEIQGSSAQPQGSSGETPETQEHSGEVPEEPVELPVKRDVDREAMKKAYAEVLNNHKADILSYENKLKDIDNNRNEMNRSQIAIYDFNGDGVEELLFVADTDQGDEYMRKYMHDLYVFGFDGKKAVPVLQKEVFPEAGGGSSYFAAGTSDYKLLTIRVTFDEYMVLEAVKYGWSPDGVTTEYSLDANGISEGRYSLTESNSNGVQVSEQELTEKVEELVAQCNETLLCNYMYRDLSFFNVQEKPGMTYKEAMDSLGVDLSPETEPKEFLYYDGHTYAFYNAEELDLNSYAAAAEFCRRQNGHLAVINSPEENEYLFNKLKANYVETAFFGYSDENKEGDWVWAEGNSNYKNWTTEGDWNLPDNGADWGGNEDYAEFNYERGKEDWVPCDGTWNDATFRENTDVFICEWDFEI